MLILKKKLKNSDSTAKKSPELSSEVENEKQLLFHGFNQGNI